MKTDQTPSMRRAWLTRHLIDMMDTPSLRDEFHGVNAALIETLVDVSCSRTETFEEARRNVFAHIAVAKAYTRQMMRGRRRTSIQWANVLAHLLDDPSYLDSFDNFTVDGTVMVDLIVALNVRTPA